MNYGNLSEKGTNMGQTNTPPMEQIVHAAFVGQKPISVVTKGTGYYGWVNEIDTAGFTLASGGKTSRKVFWSKLIKVRCPELKLEAEDM